MMETTTTTARTDGHLPLKPLLDWMNASAALFGFIEPQQETTMDETQSNAIADAIPAIVEAHRSGWRPAPTALDLIAHMQHVLTKDIPAQDLWANAIALDCALGVVDDDREVDKASGGMLPLVREDIPGGYAEKTPLQVLTLLIHLDVIAHNPELVVKLVQRLNERMHATFLPALIAQAVDLHRSA